MIMFCTVAGLDSGHLHRGRKRQSRALLCPGDLERERCACDFNVDPSADGLTLPRRLRDQPTDLSDSDEGVVGSDAGDDDAQQACVPHASSSVAPAPEGVDDADGGRPSAPAQRVGDPANAGFIVDDTDTPEFVFNTRDIVGVRVCRENFWSKTDPSRSYVLMAVFCQCPVHGTKCAKRRAIGAPQQTELGVWQPVAYLMVWAARQQEFADQATHLKCAPTLQEQRDWLNAHRRKP